MVLTQKHHAMRKLTDEEYRAMNLTGRGRQSAFSVAVSGLAVGEVLYLPAEEWGRKYHPGNTVHYIARKHRRKFVVMREASGKGWTVKRVA
jgi:hypothetical protein